MQSLGLQPPVAVLQHPGGPNKMVSLDLLLGSPPATPRESPLQPVDPLDPLVQQLVQDKAFLTAVQTSQLHAAASAAVRLLRSHFAGASEFKRPLDRRGAGASGRDLYGGADPAPDSAPARIGSGIAGASRMYSGGVGASIGAGAGGIGAVPGGPPSALLVQRQLVEPRHREALRCMRLDVLGLEDIIPWNSVRRTWKGKRTTWRRQVKQAEGLSEFATRLKELRAALLTDDAPLPGCGSTWRAQLETVIQGKGTYGLLAAAWEEMRGTIRSWLDGRSRPVAASAAALQAGAVRAVRAMQAALAGAEGGGNSEAGADAALLQVPLESIVGHDSGAGLHAVRHAIEVEQRILGARLAGRSTSQQQPAEGGGGNGGGGAGDGNSSDQPAGGQHPQQGQQQGQQQPLVSYFSSISAAWAESDFDSGVDSDPMEASAEGTDMDSDYDP